MTYISLIIPVYNNLDFLLKCLESLKHTRYKDKQIIVVDDASTQDIKAHLDSSINYYRLQTQSGPAAARNFGAKHATGDILMFIDSDVIVRSDTISKIVTDFEQNPNIAAVFGSYDSEPDCEQFLSQYKNLMHHFVHQNSSSDANTFWAGCGAIRKSVFEDLGGFDANKYTSPSIEDIELGYRLKKKGYSIYLDKDIQVKHLKSWNFVNWLKVEITKRAIPWSQLIVETGNFHSDLNLKISDRISALVVWLFILGLLITILAIFTEGMSLTFGILPVLVILFIAYILLNFRFYKFLYVKKGFIFAVKSIPFHFMYYMYSSLSFVYIWIRVKLNF